MIQILDGSKVMVGRRRALVKRYGPPWDHSRLETIEYIPMQLPDYAMMKAWDDLIYFAIYGVNRKANLC